MGNEAATINNKEEAAASAKKASEAELHIEVARVLKPGGESINVAGNSFRVSKKTKALLAITVSYTHLTLPTTPYV